MEKTLHYLHAIKKLTEMVTDIRTCMFCTTKPNGKMSSRPMTTAHVSESGELWFFANNISDLSIQVEQDNDVCLNYAHPVKNNFLSVSGKARIINDPYKIKEFWTPSMKAWFPQGTDDPNLVLIKVTPNEALYWDSSSNKPVTLFAMLRAAMRRKMFEPEFGRLNM